MIQIRSVFLAQIPMLILAASTLGAQSVACEAGVVATPELPVAPGTLKARRASLMDALGGGVAVVPATSPARRPGGHPMPSSDFEYLTGLELHEAWLVLGGSASDRPGAALYLGQEPTADGPEESAASLSGISDVRCFDDASGQLATALQSQASTTPGPILFLSLGMRGQASEDVVAVLDTTDLVIENLRPLIAQLRVVKDEDELERLRRAAEHSAQGAMQGMLAAEPGMGEADIQEVIESAFQANGSMRTSFPSIVASGSNALELHYSDNVSTLTDGDLLLTDVGAEYAGYAGDVTRTYPISGRFTDRQRELYELVLSTQEAAIDAVRPGVTIEDLNRIAREFMAEHSGELCGAETCDTFFIHGLSHHLGLDVHDPGLPNLPLAPGMVVTVEPGIYIPEEGIGIRIEDDVLVTPHGHEVLSTSAPKSVVEIEAAMASDG